MHRPFGYFIYDETLCITSPTAPIAFPADFAIFFFFGRIIVFAIIPTAVPTIMPAIAAFFAFIMFMVFFFCIFTLLKFLHIVSSKAVKIMNENIFYI